MNKSYIFWGKPKMKKLKEFFIELNEIYNFTTNSRIDVSDKNFKKCFNSNAVQKIILEPKWESLEWEDISSLNYLLFSKKEKKHYENSLLWIGCGSTNLLNEDYLFNLIINDSFNCFFKWQDFFQSNFFEYFYYGYSFEMHKSDEAYYHGVGFNIPKDTKEMSSKKSKWKNVKDRSNVFYMLFNQNFITQKHLDLNILGKPLYQQIEERGAGSLKELGLGIWLWELNDEEKSLIEEDLIKSGHVIAC